MRIGSSLSGIDLIARHSLLQAFSRLSLSSMRLATLQRINTGSDDPAGSIAAESLRSELTAIKEASYNAARAEGMTRAADSALGEVSDLLNSIRGNVVAAAGGGLSDAELAARQMEIDAALEAINRIGTATSYGGRKLLDGSTATFVLSPEVGDTSTLELPEISTSALGGPAGRLSDLAGGGGASLSSGNFSEAADILDAAGSQVLEARVTAGAFEKYTLESAERLLESMEVNTSSALSGILDTDVAEETSRLIQSQILVNTAISSLMIAGQRRGLIGELLKASCQF